jgi:hypothetical protein
LTELVEVVGPAINLDAITNAIQVELVERLGTSWDEMYGRLVAYKKKCGDCLVRRSYKDKQLATWVSNQRVMKNKGKLEPVHVQRLEELGFVWDPKELKGPVQTESTKKKKGRYINELQILPGEK